VSVADGGPGLLATIDWSSLESTSAAWSSWGWRCRVAISDRPITFSRRVRPSGRQSGWHAGVQHVLDSFGRPRGRSYAIGIAVTTTNDGDGHSGVLLRISAAFVIRSQTFTMPEFSSAATIDGCACSSR